MSKNDTNHSGNMTDKQAMSALKQNAGNILATIAIVLAGYFGWTYFQDHKPVAIDSAAASQYAQVETLAKQIDASYLATEQVKDAGKREQMTKELDGVVEGLVGEHERSIYTWQALMLKARIQMDAGDYTGASQALKLASQMQIDDVGLKSIAQLRYAQALLAAKDTEGAMSAASSEMPNSFEASRQEILGDIYLATDEIELAKRSYQNAWELLSERKQHRQILALKMEGLGMEFAPIEEELVVAMPAVSEDS